MTGARFRGIVLLVFAAFFSSLGQLLWKLSYGQGGWLIFAGLAVTVAGAGLMVIGLQLAPLARGHAILSTSTVFSVLLAWAVLGEGVGMRELLGIGLILIAILFIVKGR